MIQSMTGYGRYEGDYDGLIISVEARSVNSRYLDINLRTPDALAGYEGEIRKRVQEFFDRGQFTIKVTLNGTEDKWAKLSIDRTLLENYQRLIADIQQSVESSQPPTMSDYLNLPDIIKYEQEIPESDALLQNVMDALLHALNNIKEMRLDEGESLAKDMNNRLNFIDESIVEIENRSEDNSQIAKTTMEERIQELLDDVSVDQDRLAQEIAYIADKIDITEETVRLRSHVQQFYSLLKKEGSVGKKLNFLLQEMNREVNTMGAKANHAEISHIVVDCKNEIEKLREQVQNVE